MMAAHATTEPEASEATCTETANFSRHHIYMVCTQGGRSTVGGARGDGVREGGSGTA